MLCLNMYGCLAGVILGWRLWSSSRKRLNSAVWFYRISFGCNCLSHNVFSFSNLFHSQDPTLWMGASFMCDCLISSGAVVSSNYPNGDYILNLILDSRQGGKKWLYGVVSGKHSRKKVYNYGCNWIMLFKQRYWLKKSFRLHSRLLVYSHWPK